MTLDRLGVRDALRSSLQTGPLVLLVAAGLAAFSALIVTRLDPVLTAGLAAGFVLLVLSLRWPLLPLFVFVVLVPIEEAVSIDGLGTLSRLCGILFAVVYGVPRLGRLTLRAMPRAGWAYVGWAILSLAWALDPNTTFLQFQTLVQLFVIAVLVADVVVHDPTVIRPLLWVYSASAALTACIGIAGYLSGGVSAGGRVGALSEDPAQFAALLLPALVFSLHELLNGRQRIPAGTIALLCTAGIMLSGTRGAWVSAAVVVAFLIIPRLGFRRGIAAMAVVLAMLVVAFQIPGVADLVAKRTENAAASGGSGRTDIWTVGIEIFQSGPVVGVGFANFPVAFTPQMVQAANPASFTGLGRAPHNIVIGTLGELGLIGLALLALFLVPLILRRGWGPDATVVQAILACLMIDALFLDVLSNRKQVWLAIGLAAGLAYLGRRSRVSGIPATGGPLDVTGPTTSAGREGRTPASPAAASSRGPVPGPST